MIERIDEELCTGCGDCDLACPMDVIHMDREKKKAEVRYKDDCMTCFNCELACPVDAVFVNPIKREKLQPW